MWSLVIDIASNGDAWIESGSGVAAGFSGEVASIISKGVEAWVLSSVSKLENPDDGLVKGGDGGVLVGSVVSRLPKKRPKLSLLCPWLFVFATIAK